ncbi:MAG TPA: ATP-binding cassette domain-containing protein, partial [Gammaproteobacteria bacterium]|nr:ATP-binding cassette domain-containing protein [Gammaproteobacteria bacterium]
MLNVQNLALQYGRQELFSNSTFQCRPKQRFGITGKNGAGKSSLLRILAGTEKASGGEYSLPMGAQLGMLSQDHFKYESWPVVDVVVSGNAALWRAFKQKEVLLAKADFTEEDGLQLGALEEQIAHHRGYEAQSIAQTLLSGLGIVQEKHQGPMSSLSGGFKLRVLLAQVLFQNPDLLLLDEPTNHLDITSIHWLEEYLKEEFDGIVLFVSHDKHFLNTVATHILDIDYGAITPYTGNYDRSLELKHQAEEQRSSARKHQEAKVEQLQTFVEKYGAKASKAKQAKSKQKQIDRIELTEIKTTNRGAPYFSFKQARPTGKRVVTLDNIKKSFGDLTVLNRVSVELLRGEKVAIIGANGIGKSTLLKIIVNELPADEGKFDWGHEVQMGYFAQDHHEQLKGNQTLFHFLEDKAPHDMRDKVRSVLGQMLFSGDDAHKTISQLSGGEAARLLIGSLIITQPNVLVMDEPTNHLDLEAISALAKALKAYPGTCLFVSHDRDFVRALATRIIVLTPHGLADITASYDEYLDA